MSRGGHSKARRKSIVAQEQEVHDRQNELDVMRRDMEELQRDLEELQYEFDLRQYELEEKQDQLQRDRFEQTAPATHYVGYHGPALYVNSTPLPATQPAQFLTASYNSLPSAAAHHQISPSCSATCGYCYQYSSYPPAQLPQYQGFQYTPSSSSMAPNTVPPAPRKRARRRDNRTRQRGKAPRDIAMSEGASTAAQQAESSTPLSNAVKVESEAAQQAASTTQLSNVVEVESGPAQQTQSSTQLSNAVKVESGATQQAESSTQLSTSIKVEPGAAQQAESSANSSNGATAQVAATTTSLLGYDVNRSVKRIKRERED
ncbi:unnamed protein product [Sympodiomycopsis kandeliae]